MLGSRRGRPSLIGRAAQTAARTAVIAGTATAVSGKVAARQAGAAPAPQPAAPETAPPAAPAAAPAPGGLTDEAIARLKQLSELHAAGVLTAEEFAEQKARILA
ncbi:MAG TPA: SHOCT domain-containing protein [Amaricoccus sp.]|nr:SHOCT domain-containing protein [Amaricoccus sp.]